MTTKRDVECFLEQFKIKLDIYDIVFRTRTNDKNERTLFALDITSRYRKDVIRNLEVRDYSQGPLADECGRRKFLPWNPSTLSQTAPAFTSGKR